MELESRPSSHRRHLRRAWAFWSVVSVALTLVTLALYLLWGFRWPPTAVAVEGPGSGVVASRGVQGAAPVGR
jgi:hypothetical protein